MKNWNWHKIIWFTIAGIFAANAGMQCYNMGYSNARFYYEQREFDLECKHTDRLIEEIKKRHALEDK